MCTYIVEKVEIKGSAKGRNGWFSSDEVVVSFDHPVHAMEEHTLNIDFLKSDGSATDRVALEIRPADALKFAKTILAVLEEAPDTLK